MYIDANTIITAGAVLAAILAIGGGILAVYRWYLKQNHQSTEIAELKCQHNEDVMQIKEENTLLCYGLAACLDGLIQLGCNHSVTDAKDRLDKYLNKQAHH